MKCVLWGRILLRMMGMILVVVMPAHGSILARESPKAKIDCKNRAFPESKFNGVSATLRRQLSLNPGEFALFRWSNRNFDLHHINFLCAIGGLCHFEKVGFLRPSDQIL